MARSSRGLKKGTSRVDVVTLLLGMLGISTAFGMLLLLPLHVHELGGDESSFGVILSAATLPAVMCIGFLLRYPDRIRPSIVVAIAMAMYAMGAGGISLVSDSWQPLIGIGILLGTAWAVIYTASPMIMSDMVTDAGRATYFGYLTGSQQVGIGAGPVIAQLLVETPLGYRGTFLIAGAISLLATVLMTAVQGPTPRLPAAGTRAGLPTASRDDATRTDLGGAIARIIRSEAIFSLLMIVLFACLFTSMSQFQTTFAASRNLDYSVFYVAYTVAVVFSRFVLAKVTSRFDPRLIIAVSVTAMTLAVAAFLVVGSNPLLYATASAILGMSYGLALPGVQAQAVNVSQDDVRPRVLPLAGLVFQSAILGFPLIAGRVIADAGYEALFAVLLSFAIAQMLIGWWRYAAAGKTTHLTPATRA